MFKKQQTPQTKSIKKLKALWWPEKIQFYYSFDWGSEQPQYRTKIHKNLNDCLLRLEQKKKVPAQNSKGSHLKKFTSSISHCPGLGGFVISEATDELGLDIELTARIKKKTVERISESIELHFNWPFELLWCAKEASYKALRGPQQPDTITEITIYNVVKVYKNRWLFSALCKTNKKNLSGIAWQNKTHSFVVAF